MEQAPRDSGQGSRLALLALLCVPGLVASGTPALDTITRSMFGSALTTWGSVGGLLGSAALLSGVLSILAWPGVVLLSYKSAWSGRLRVASQVAIVMGCIVATYSAASFMIFMMPFVMSPGVTLRSL